MGSSTIGVSASSAPSTLAQTFTATSANTLYASTVALAIGTYTVSCAATSAVNVDFWNGSTYIGRATTVSGTTTYNLSTAATKLEYWTTTGSNVIISLQLTGQALTTAPSGTLDTLTTSQTYNQTGAMYVIVVGGGGGGSGGSGSYGGGGGGSGGVNPGILNISSPVTVTIGAQGNGGSGLNSGNAGGASTFSNLTANGGGGGNTLYSGGGGYGGAAGTPSGGVGGASGGAATASTSSPYSFIVSGTTGGGGGSGSNAGVYPAGAGSGIGAGGAGSPPNIPGGAGTGYGAGGGGGGTNGGNTSGGAGSPGVVYVVRGF